MWQLVDRSSHKNVRWVWFEDRLRLFLYRADRNAIYMTCGKETCKWCGVTCYIPGFNYVNDKTEL